MLERVVDDPHAGEPAPDVAPSVVEPMVDFGFFRSRSFLGANLVAFIVSFAMLAMFFFLALYMQNILGYSPQARGRSERMNRTWQGRLVNELRVAGITTVAAANRYIRDRFVSAFNDEFRRPPADPAAAFVPLGRTARERHEAGLVVHLRDDQRVT